MNNGLQALAAMIVFIVVAVLLIYFGTIVLGLIIVGIVFSMIWICIIEPIIDKIKRLRMR